MECMTTVTVGKPEKVRMWSSYMHMTVITMLAQPQTSDHKV